ncbi:exodeoxyribonuclease VII small subunit [Candidatus Saccharibacteria bacterium]|nr:exodeoxyribonuclease VII small subunit [Candidatus Saccharibacteria bacterium]
MTEKVSLNSKIKELDARVEWFYSDEFKLEDAVEKYKSAVKLAKEIEDDLKNLKNEIEVIEKDFSMEM